MAILCAVGATGCASWQLPRIDPTGERLLLMPGEPQPTYTGPVAPGALLAPPPVPPSLPPTTTVPAAPVFGAPATAPPIAVPPPPPPSVGMPVGNMQAPPAYPDAGLAPTPSTTFAPTTAPALPPSGPPPPPGAPQISVPPPTPIPPSVDAQWAIPASTTADGGRALILTTIVSRRTVSAPLPSWIVRYEVNGAAATVGGSGYIDVPTDASGRASVEVSPNDPNGGTAIVTIILLPPTQQGGAPIEIARGTTSITWTPLPPPPIGATPSLAVPPPGYLPSTPGPSFGPPSSTYGPPSTSTARDGRPSLPPDTPTAGRYGQPSTQEQGSNLDNAYAVPPKPPEGKPRLEVKLRTTSPEPAKVGDYARFEVTVTNRGDGTAKNIVVLDDFDRGLEHQSAKPNEQAVRYDRMRDLPPGEFDTVALTFRVAAAGRLCHKVTVSADGAVSAVADSCITAVDPLPATPPTLEVTKQGPIRQYVGEVARFKNIVKNTGQVAVKNVKIVDRYDSALDPVAEAGATEVSRGQYEWTIPEMLPGERREFNVQCSCVAPATSACSTVQVTADGGVSFGDQKCLEILQLNAQAPGAGPALTSPPQAPAGPSGLRVSCVESAGPARVGAPLTLFFTIENAGSRSESNVQLRVLLPQEVTPITAQIQPAGAFQIVGEREIRFTAIPSLRPGEKQQASIPVQVNLPGRAAVVAGVAADGMAQAINMPSKDIEILPATGN